MKLVPRQIPEPCLLSTAVEPGLPVDALTLPGKLKDESYFSGRGRAVSIGIGVGTILLSGAGWLVDRHHHLKPEELHLPKILAVATDTISDSPTSSATPSPVVVQFNPEVLRVTAIVLGHPRLAVINGRSVTEGEAIVVHVPNMSVAVTLRVVKISDGYIELANGSQRITARLNVPPLVPLKAAHK